MMNEKVTLLDCTLRDGGYINNWMWGFDTAKNLIEFLAKAKIEVVEVGFLRDVESYSPDVLVCNKIEELNRLLPTDKKYQETKYSAMAMRSNYDITKLTPYSGEGIEIIRVTAHENDIYDGIEFAYKVMQKGYKVSINPINIMGYDDQTLIEILKKVNDIHPWQFAIVDTFGSMKRRDLDRIVALVDHNLDRDIKVAIHLHENMAQSFSLAQNFVDKNLDRPTSIDGSLLGMGRIPGNLPIELIADYLNEYRNKNYEIDFLLDAIQDYISLIKGEPKWGYNPAYFLSAKYNLHRNYAEYYLNKGDLIARDINHLLSRYDQSKAAVYDEKYAEEVYSDYMNNKVDDRIDKEKLKKYLDKKKVLVLAPGKSIITEKTVIEKYISDYNPVVIAINFKFDEYHIDYLFFGNNRRYSQTGNITEFKTIATSNVRGKFDFYIDHNSVSGAYKQGTNTLIMLLSLLASMGIYDVAIAGADGFKNDSVNYYKDTIVSASVHSRNHNIEVAEAIKRIGIKVRFITTSCYEEALV